MATLTGISISPATLELVPGSATQFTITGTYSNSTTQNLTAVASYTASIGQILSDGYYLATVAGIGSITASVTGTVTVTGATVYTASCQVVCDQISTISPGNASTIVGQTVLVFGVVSGMVGRSYNVPYTVTSLVTAATFYGNGTRLTQALGELLRQNAAQIMVVAIPDETQYKSLFDSILNVPFDILVPAGLTANSTRIPIYTQFAQTREQVGLPITVVMSVDPTPGVAALTTSPIGLLAGVNTSTSPSYTNSRYFVFTLDAITINPNIPSQYQADAAPSVAGLISRTTPWTSITGQQLYGAVLSSSQFGGTDSQNLANAGYITLRQSIRHGLCIAAAVTGASSISTNQNYSINFQRLMSIRITNYTLTKMRQALRQYIGTSQGNAIISTATSLLKSLKQQGIILASDYNISISQLAGTATVSYSILVPYETSTITLTTMVGAV